MAVKQYLTMQLIVLFTVIALLIGLVLLGVMLDVIDIRVSFRLLLT